MSVSSHICHRRNLGEPALRGNWGNFLVNQREKFKMTVIGLQLTRLWLRKYISGFIQSNSATQLFNSSWLFYLEGTYKKYKKLALIPAFGRFLPLIKMTLQRKYFCIHHSVFFILPTKADVFSMCDTIVLVVERNYIFKSFDSRYTLQMTWYTDEKWYVSENWRELYTVCSSRSSEMNFFFRSNGFHLFWSCKLMGLE